MIDHCVSSGSTVNVAAGHKFAYSIDNCKMSFYRVFNAIFGKMGRIAPEDVITELLKAKCLPALYYGLEAYKTYKVYLLYACFMCIYLPCSGEYYHYCTQ